MSMINGTLVASVSGNALTIAVKTLAGNDPSAADPVQIVFRNATAATGDYIVRTLTTATSLVISSGSSLGVAANSTAFKIWIVGFDDGGVFRLGAFNAVSGKTIAGLSAYGLASSTAEGGAGAADSAQVFYTGTAVAAKPYAVLGFMTWGSGLASVGAWAAGPTLVQLFNLVVPLPGQRTGNYSLSEYAANAALSTSIPVDDTIPQQSEGTQILAVAITPTDPSHVVNLRFSGQVTATGVDNVTAALFVNSTADALRAIMVNVSAADVKVMNTLEALHIPNSVSSQSYKIRVGGGGAAVRLNGPSSARLLGGASAAVLVAEEISS
jgi:hypothetical protein